MSTFLSEKLKKLNISPVKKFNQLLWVLIPLLLTDFVIIAVIINSENNARIHEMENVANGVHYTFMNQVDLAAQLSKGIYTSRYVNEFINKKFDSNLEYFSEYHDFFDDTLIDLVDAASSMEYTIYIDNDTIISGSEFQQLDKAIDCQWYRYMENSGLGRGLYFDYTNRERSVYFFQRLNFYDKDSQNILLVELDYSVLVRNLTSMNYENKAYICDNERILLSNSNFSSIGKDYYSVETLENPGFTYNFGIYGQNLEVIVMPQSGNPLASFKGWWILIILLVLFNILIPVNVINMGVIREQEMMVARQNAELLALHSQINPHFLFNALESIRMHSLIKGENETAVMVERLAKLQRQYTEWQQDSVTISKEMEFVEAYLGIQKYRFGERLSFELEVADDCQELMIPKLTIVTFVENACVHGIESKTTAGWIFVRISKAEDVLVMEIEDTGNGMTEEENKELLDRMQNSNIEMLKNKGRVGIVNACLRLKMSSNNMVSFNLESEEGVGTIVTIRLPLGRQ